MAETNQCVVQSSQPLLVLYEYEGPETEREIRLSRRAMKKLKPALVCQNQWFTLSWPWAIIGSYYVMLLCHIAILGLLFSRLCMFRWLQT